jgi:hypothetical protein
MLEIARAVTRMIREGKLQRPERDIRFWWTNEIDGPYDYFALHPEEVKSTFVNINQDMVGVNQTVGGLSRVQQVTRTPWSRPTFLNDVVESIVMSLYYGNNSYIAARQAQSTPPGSPYSRPIYSRNGSRDRYSVEITPFFNNTDAMPFNDAWTAAQHGGITFTNWPDEYIHSSADDMWQMDPTTFKRNAVAVTAIAWFMANAGAKEADSLTRFVNSSGLVRVNRDSSELTAAVLQGRAFEGDWAVVIEESVSREVRVIDSINTISDDPETRNATRATVEELLRLTHLKPDVSQGQHHTASSNFEALLKTIPIRTASAIDYRKKEHDLKRPKGLHLLMAFEALNFIDGKRTIWDIYAACRAESLAGGEWYYGTVTPEAIKEYLDNAAKLGLITMQPAPPPAAPSKKSPKTR